MAGPGVQSLASRDSAALGIALIVLAVFLLCALDAMVKWLTDGYALTQIIFFRHLFGLLPILVLTHARGGLAALATRRPMVHLLRVAIILSIAYGFFWALKHMELADATALFFTVPMFITMLSVLVLGEVVGMRRWMAVAAGFAGVVLIVKPGTGVFNAASLVVLAVSLLYAVLMISNRALRATETPAALTFYMTLGCIAATGAALPWVWVAPAAFDLLLLAGIGILGGTGQILLVMAYRHAQASVLAPFEYLSLIWATIFGFLVFADLPDVWTVIGAVVVAAGGVYLVRRETVTKPSDGTVVT